MSGISQRHASLIFCNRLPSDLSKGRTLLGYHKVAVSPPGTIGRSNFIRPELLRQQLLQVQLQGAVPGRLEEVVNTGHGERGKFAVTFDDGYANLFDSGLEVLRDSGVRALVYLVAGQLGGSNVWDSAKGDIPLPLMSQSQIRIWIQEGHSIGSHTMSHAVLTHLSEESARRELRESKDCLEQTFGVPIEHFCYPYGSWDGRVQEWVREAGYKTAVTVEQRKIAPSDSPWCLPRWMVYTHPLPWLANLRENLRSRWGKVLVPSSNAVC